MSIPAALLRFFGLFFLLALPFWYVPGQISASAAETAAEDEMTAAKSGSLAGLGKAETGSKSAAKSKKGAVLNYEIPKETRDEIVTVSVESAGGKTYSYTIFHQSAKGLGGYRKFLRWHGCSTCSLTTLLRARVPKLKDLLPGETISRIERKVFPKSVVEQNYSRSIRQQRSVSMYGITKILNYYGIKTKYVHSFSRERACEEIEAHLEKGKPVFVTVKKGKWAQVYHTMLLIGMDKKGRAIVADSANRKWSGKEQRVKYARVSELLKSMWSGGSTSSVYWNGYYGCGGYVLVY